MSYSCKRPDSTTETQLQPQPSLRPDCAAAELGGRACAAAEKAGGRGSSSVSLSFPAGLVPAFFTAAGEAGFAPVSDH